MPASILTAFTPIPERSEATPGLFNSRLQQVQDNLLSINTGGGVFFNVRSFGATGDGTTDDRAAIGLATAAAAGGGIVYFPAGSYRIASAMTFSSSVGVMFAPQAKLVVPAATKVYVNGPVHAGRHSIFSTIGSGLVEFRDANGVSPVVDTVYPEWFGAASGDGLASAVDCSPAVQAAVLSGVRRILYGEGTYKHLSTISIHESPTASSDVLFEGTSRAATILQAGKSNIGTPNALFVNNQNNGKLSWKNLRFSGTGGVSAFTGYAIYAREDSDAQAIFSGSIDNCWVSMGESATGFFYGALNNYRVSDSVFEATKVRFNVEGLGFSDVQFTNIADYSNYDPFLDMANDASAKNLVTLNNIHAYVPLRGYLVRANNCDALNISNVIYQVFSALTTLTGMGVAELTSCPRLSINNVKAQRFPASVADMASVISLRACQGVLDGVTVDGGDVQLSIQSTTDLLVANSTFSGAGSFSVRFPLPTTGRVVFANSRLQYAGLNLVQHAVSGQTHDLLFSDCDLLDSGYPSVSGAQYGMTLETAGEVRVVGGRVGRTATPAVSNMTAMFLFAGRGSYEIVGSTSTGTAPLVNSLSTVFRANGIHNGEISSLSAAVAAMVVQGSASSFVVVPWARVRPGDLIQNTVSPDAAVSSMSSGLVPHSHCTQAGQFEFRLSNVSTLAQNQSAKTWYFYRTQAF